MWIGTSTTFKLPTLRYLLWTLNFKNQITGNLACDRYKILFNIIYWTCHSLGGLFLDFSPSPNTFWFWHHVLFGIEGKNSIIVNDSVLGTTCHYNLQYYNLTYLARSSISAKLGRLYEVASSIQGKWFDFTFFLFLGANKRSD